MPDRSNHAGAITIRDAQVLDAPAMGELMVTTWLRAHRSHIPPAAWHRRQASWTPEASAAGCSGTSGNVTPTRAARRRVT